MPSPPNPAVPSQVCPVAESVTIALRPRAGQRLPDSALIDRIVDSFLRDPQARRFELRVLPAPRPRDYCA